MYPSEMNFDDCEHENSNPGRFTPRNCTAAPDPSTNAAPATLTTGAPPGTGTTTVVEGTTVVGTTVEDTTVVGTAVRPS